MYKDILDNVCGQLKSIGVVVRIMEQDMQGVESPFVIVIKRLNTEGKSEFSFEQGFETTGELSTEEERDMAYKITIEILLSKFLKNVQRDQI